MSDDQPSTGDSTPPRRPRLSEALLADASATAAFRGERHRLQPGLDGIVQIVRLSLVSDAFAAQLLYRLEVAARHRRIPLLPRILHRLAIVAGGVYVAEEAVIGPGLYLLHGQVVIEGPARIGPRVQIAPGVTIAPRSAGALGVGGEDDRGEEDGSAPRIGAGVSLGSGSRVLGGVTVGAGAVVGANAVVLDDVPDGATAVGIPAEPIAGGDPA